MLPVDQPWSGVARDLIRCRWPGPEHRNAAALPTSSMVTLRRRGVALIEGQQRETADAEAARVLMGPAEMAWQVPSGPADNHVAVGSLEAGQPGGRCALGMVRTAPGRG